ncbi:hypothetical protein BH10CYA1_BH10CYA1_28120 [soil metagenome]
MLTENPSDKSISQKDKPQATASGDDDASIDSNHPAESVKISGNIEPAPTATEQSSAKTHVPTGTIAADLMKKTANKMKAMSLEAVKPIRPQPQYEKSESTDTGELPTVSEEDANAFIADELDTQSDFSPLTAASFDSLRSKDLGDVDLELDLEDYADNETDAGTEAAADAAAEQEKQDLLSEANALLALCLDQEEQIPPQTPEASASKPDKIALKLPEVSNGLLLRQKRPGSQTQTLNRIAFPETTKETPQSLPRNGLHRFYGPMMIVTSIALFAAVAATFYAANGTKQSTIDSADSLSRAISASPKNADLYIRRGRKNLEAGNYDLAQRDFRKTLKLSPTENLSEVYAALATCSEHLHQDEQAVSNWTTAIEHDPQQQANYLPQRAACYLRLKAFQKAAMDYKALLGLRPNDSEINYLAGHCFYLQNKYEKALPFLTTAIAINGSETKYYTERANSYFILKQYNHALADFDRVLKDQPHLQEISNKRAIALAQTKKVTASDNRVTVNTSHVDIAALTRLAKTDSHHVLQLGYEALSAGKPSEAVDIFAVLVKNNPNDPMARHSLAKALLAIKSFDEAEHQFVALQELRPLTAEEQNQYGEALAGITALRNPPKSESTTPENQGNNPVVSDDNNNPIARDNNTSAAMANDISSTSPKRIAPPSTPYGQSSLPAARSVQSLGNNQSINAWQNFKGLERKK